MVTAGDLPKSLRYIQSIKKDPPAVIIMVSADGSSYFI